MKYAALKSLLALAATATTLFMTNQAFATSDPMNVSTTVDCLTGDDTKAAPFDDSKTPYLTLKRWIEDSIAFLNAHPEYTSPDYPASQGKDYTIKVKGGCTFFGKDGNTIALNFAWAANDNTIQIIWMGGHFKISNIAFDLNRTDTGNISFTNVDFVGNDVTGYYFFNSQFEYPQSGYWCFKDWRSYNWSGISINNSLIRINSGKQFAQSEEWHDGRCWNRKWNGGYSITNAAMKVFVQNDYNFRLPVIVKDAKIDFVRSGTGTTPLNITVTPAGMGADGYAYESMNVVSSEFDLGWNNFITQNSAVVFINNRFKNVGTFTAGSDTTTAKQNVFVNNSIESTNEVDITKNDLIYNNVFSSGFVDTGDADNFKRNFSGTSTVEKWVGWVFRKRTGGQLSLDVNYKTLYEELNPGSVVEDWANPMYIVIQ